MNKNRQQVVTWDFLVEMFIPGVEAFLWYQGPLSLIKGILIGPLILANERTSCHNADKSCYNESFLAWIIRASFGWAERLWLEYWLGRVCSPRTNRQTIRVACIDDYSSKISKIGINRFQISRQKSTFHKRQFWHKNSNETFFWRFSNITWKIGRSLQWCTVRSNKEILRG